MFQISDQLYPVWTSCTCWSKIFTNSKRSNKYFYLFRFSTQFRFNPIFVVKLERGSLKSKIYFRVSIQISHCHYLESIFQVNFYSFHKVLWLLMLIWHSSQSSHFSSWFIWKTTAIYSFLEISPIRLQILNRLDNQVILS